MPITGTEHALTVREHFPQIFLTMVEELSDVLIEMLKSQEVDFILGYDAGQSGSACDLASGNGSQGDWLFRLAVYHKCRAARSPGKRRKP